MYSRIVPIENGWQLYEGDLLIAAIYQSQKSSQLVAQYYREGADAYTVLSALRVIRHGGGSKEDKIWLTPSQVTSVLPWCRIYPDFHNSSATRTGGTNDSFPFYSYHINAPLIQFANLRAFRPVKDSSSTRLIRSYPEDFLTADSLSTHFTDEARVKASFSKDVSSFDFWQDRRNTAMLRKEAERIRDFAKQHHRFIPWSSALRDALYHATKECAMFPVCLALQAIYTLFPDPEQRSTVKWLDPSAGWGDRACAALAADIHSYHAFDPNPLLAAPFFDLERTLRPASKLQDFRFYNLPFSSLTLEHYDLVMTSPPFYDMETYNAHDPQQSLSKHGASYESWRDGFLKQYVTDAWQSIKEGGYFALYINNLKSTKRNYPIANDVAKLLLPCQPERFLSLSVVNSDFCKASAKESLYRRPPPPTLTKPREQRDPTTIPRLWIWRKPAVQPF